MKLNLKDKKGASLMIMVLGLIVLTLIAVLIFTLGANKIFTKERGAILGTIENLGDPDGDEVPNIKDKCPCIPRCEGGKGTIEGCPDGISLQAANNDLKKFQNEKKCIEIDFCGGQGPTGNWDLVVESFSLSEGGGKKGDSQVPFRVDLEGIKTSVKTGIHFNVKNGAEAIPNQFKTNIYVCNKGKDDCKKEKEYFTVGLNEGKVISGDGEGTNYITLGDGDYCDCSGANCNGECWVKIVADAESNVDELNENNNDKWIYVFLEKQG
ncbi:hypothetical protein HOC13_02920 [Candidatus Woesearchaeota archaeon]|nr:hypothetical protein [Candidatus Woesearchaeota archaeon]